MTKLIIVRHGETEWNRVERFRGRYDIPLNQTGLSQAEKSARFIATHWKPVAVYSSPLNRAMETATAIARANQLTVQPHPQLIDIDYGDWQGLTPEEVRMRWTKQARNWYEHPDQAQVPNGETLIQVQKRAMQAVYEICALHPNEDVVLVSHTVVNRLLLLAMVGAGVERFWHIRQEPCAINLVEADGQDFTIISMNDICHLRS
jgi:probable phosphoglycerate mutase